MLSGPVEIFCGATLPSCTTALILLAYNKRDQPYQNSRILACYTYFHVSCWTLGPAFVESTKESYRTGEHFNSTLVFRKIRRQIHSPRKESLEIRTERTFSNTKHKVRQSYATQPTSPFLCQALPCLILPNTAVKDVFNYSTQMQKTGGCNYVYFQPNITLAYPTVLYRSK